GSAWRNASSRAIDAGTGIGVTIRRCFVATWGTSLGVSGNSRPIGLLPGWRGSEASDSTLVVDGDRHTVRADRASHGLVDKAEVRRVRGRGDQAGGVDLGEPPLPRRQVARRLHPDGGLHERFDGPPAVADHLLAGAAVGAGEEAHVIAAAVSHL